MKDTEGNKSLPFEPALRFVILSTLTFGVYQWYWGWRAWAILRAANRSKLNATLRGAFLGFSGFFLAKEIYKAEKLSGRSLYISAGLYLGMSLILAFAIGGLKLKGWPLLAGYLTLGLVESLALLPLHWALAKIWQSRPFIHDEAGLAPNVTLAGAMVLILYLSLKNIMGISR